MQPKDIRAVVWEHKPVLKSLIDSQGSLSVAEYFARSAPLPSRVASSRKQELIEAVRARVKGILGPETANRTATQLEQDYFISTADHHGPVCHPFFLNANLVQGIVHAREGKNCVVVLSCGGVSLNNHSFPRGVLLHDKKLHEQRLAFASLKHRHAPVWNFPGYGLKDVYKAAYQLTAQKSFSPEVSLGALSLLHEVYASEDALAFSRYADQMTLTNYRLWKQAPGQHAMELIHIQQEDIAVSLLQKHHIHSNTILHSLLFDSSFNDVFAQNFENIPGAWSDKNKGSFLFWAIRDNARIPLRKEGIHLVSLDGSYSVALEPDAIAEVLERGELMPTMALTFIILSFYYGLNCGGGFSQINYLGEMREAYLKVLDETGAPEEELRTVRSLTTDCFRGEFVLARLGNAMGSVPATLLDVILYGNPGTAAALEEVANTTSLADAVDEMMPEFYTIITGRHADYHPRNARTHCLTA